MVYRSNVRDMNRNIGVEFRRCVERMTNMIGETIAS
jgi:hypothetical protein